MRIESRILVIVALFALKFVSGIWLTRAGRPFNGILLTVHKIISLLTVVLIGLTLARLRQGIGLSAVEIAVVAFCGLLWLLTIASGGWVSADRVVPAFLTAAHRVLPFLTVLATGIVGYLVVWGI
jgi:hypothetical protein